MENKIKKSYNPLDMGGSYAGALIGFLIFFIPCSYFELNKIFGDLSRCFNFSLLFWNYPVYYVMLTGIILGFLIGWAIHSLFRRLKNE